MYFLKFLFRGLVRQVSHRVCKATLCAAAQPTAEHAPLLYGRLSRPAPSVRAFRSPDLRLRSWLAEQRGRRERFSDSKKNLFRKRQMCLFRSLSDSLKSAYMLFMFLRLPLFHRDQEKKKRTKKIIKWLHEWTNGLGSKFLALFEKSRGSAQP